MSFSGKPTYTAGADLPEIAEDVSDIIGIVSPYETPLLDWLGDAKRPAMSTVHEWLEDSLLPNTDTINQTTFTPNPTDATAITVNNAARFQVGDLVKPGNAAEVMQITAVAGGTLTVVRRFGATPGSALANGLKLTILGNAALEGADAPPARFTSRVRKQNYTQLRLTVRYGTVWVRPRWSFRHPRSCPRERRIRRRSRPATRGGRSWT